MFLLENKSLGMAQDVRLGVAQDSVGKIPGEFQAMPGEPFEWAICHHGDGHLQIVHLDLRGKVELGRGRDELERRRIIWLAALLLALEDGLPARLRAHEGDFVVVLVPVEQEPVAQQPEHSQLEEAFKGTFGVDPLKITEPEKFLVAGRRFLLESCSVRDRRGVADSGVEHGIATDATICIHPVQHQAGFGLQLVNDGEVVIDIEFVCYRFAAHGGGHLFVIDRFLEGDQLVHEALGVEVRLRNSAWRKRRHGGDSGAEENPNGLGGHAGLSGANNSPGSGRLASRKCITAHIGRHMCWRARGFMAIWNNEFSMRKERQIGIFLRWPLQA